MKRKMFKTAVAGMILLAMVSVLSLVSVHAQETSAPMDLPPRPTPKLEPQPIPQPDGDQNLELPALSLHVSTDQTHADVGDLVQLTITLSNPNKFNVGGIKLLGLLPPIFDVVKMTTTRGAIGYKAETGRLQVYDFSPLQPNTSVTVTVLVQVNDLAEVGGKYYTAAKVVGGDRYNSAGLFSNWLRLDIGGE